MNGERKAPRSRRMLVLWAVALALLLVAGLFCWLVVVPVWRTHHAVSEYLSGELDGDKAVRQLGGEASAAKAILTYRRMPHWAAPHNGDGRLLRLLGYCGEAGIPPLTEIVMRGGWWRLPALKALAFHSPRMKIAVPALAEALKDQREPERHYALVALSRYGPDARAAVPAIRRELWEPNLYAEDTDRKYLDAAGTLWRVAPESLLSDLKSTDPDRRADTAWLLARIHLADRAGEAVRAIEHLLQDEDKGVRQAAAEALEKIERKPK